MFISEQYASKGVNNQTETGDSQTGMLFAKRKTMNWKLSHRDYILLLGIVVALLVVFLLWFNQMPLQQSASLDKSGYVPQRISFPQISLVKKTVIEISHLLLP